MSEAIEIHGAPVKPINARSRSPRSSGRSIWESEAKLETASPEERSIEHARAMADSAAPREGGESIEESSAMDSAAPPSPRRRSRVGANAIDDSVAVGEGGEPIDASLARPQAAPTLSDWRGLRGLRALAAMYEDFQKFRIAGSNRALRAPVDPAVYSPSLELIARAEHLMGLELHREYRRVVPVPIRAWQQATLGIGEHLLARLLGNIGNPALMEPHYWEGAGENRKLIVLPIQPRSLRQLWGYCGHGDPGRRRRRAMGVDEAFATGNPRAKMLVHLLAECCVKVRRSPFRTVYDARREATEADLAWAGESAGHKHNDALRIVGKEILRALWTVAQEETVNA